MPRITEAEQQKMTSTLERQRAQLRDIKAERADSQGWQGMAAAFGGGYMADDIKRILGGFVRANTENERNRNTLIALWFINQYWGKDGMVNDALKGTVGAIGASVKSEGGIEKMLSTGGGGLRIVNGS